MKDGLYILPVAIKDGKVIPHKDMTYAEDFAKALSKAVVDEFLKLFEFNDEDAPMGRTGGG
jgi:hypothetical protein